MIPGVNPRQLKQMMRQMGMSQEDIDSVEVIIKTNDKEYIFNSPNVQKVTMQGQTTFQIMGDYEIRDRDFEVKINEDDIKTVCEQAGVSEDEARKALDKTKGDIAQAIINLTE